MSSNQGDNTAFPAGEDVGYFKTGLTKREWFAGMALQGLSSLTFSNLVKNINSQDAAKKAVELADALINELSKKG